MNALDIQSTLDDLDSEALLCEKKGEIDRAAILRQARKRVEAEIAREQSRTTGVYSRVRA